MRRSGVFAGGIIAVALMVAGIGVGSAGGAQPEVATIQVGDDENSWQPSEVAVQRGETVRWTWTNTSVPHNVVSAGGAWTYDSVYANSGDHSYTFPADGTYMFRCELHTDMIGKVIVGTGIPTATATPTPTPTATPTPTPTATATPDTPVPTPNPPAATPTGTAAPAATATPIPLTRDTVKPAIRSVRTTTMSKGVKVRFKLSERATIKVVVKRGSKTLTSSRPTTLAPGTRTVTVKSSKITRGKVTVEIRATDAAGNASTARSSASVKR